MGFVGLWTTFTGDFLLEVVIFFLCCWLNDLFESGVARVAFFRERIGDRY